MRMLLWLSVFCLAVQARAQWSTDLGDLGNKFVAQTLADYQALHPHGICRAANPDARRVILTGFGLFSGIPYNISGTVVAVMGSGGLPNEGALQDQDEGAVGWNREISIDGRPADVCFLVTDVIWDLAAGIILHEARNFQPDLIFMTGRGFDAARFEGGAVNNAAPDPGYDSNGRPMDGTNSLAPNVPESAYVLPNYKVGDTIAMNWNGPALANSIAAQVKKLGYGVTGIKKADPGNNYLCNNVSFVVLNAALNRDTILAGGHVKFPAGLFVKRPVVGFFHFPAVDFDHPDLKLYQSGIAGWSDVIAGAVGRALNP